MAVVATHSSANLSAHSSGTSQPPASGEGIYDVMVGGRVTAHAVHALLKTGDGRVFKKARKAIMKVPATEPWYLG